MSAAADGELRDLTIIGAGPVGLAAAFWAGMREASARIVESLPDLGGQLTALYPEKWIYDVPGHPRLRAKDLVAQMRVQALDQFDVPVHLATTAQSLERDGDALVLRTSAGELRSRAVVVAGGHGAFAPKRLTDVDLAAWEGHGVSYLVREKAELAGRRVVVVGGGDSALDWALDLVGTASAVTLVHRRERFRGHPATVARLQAAAARGEIALRTPCRIAAASGVERLEQVTLVRVDGGEDLPEELACDAVLLQLGFRTALGPLADWGFALDRGAIRVDSLMATSLPGVWACGDVTTFDGKLKLIATGFGEAATAVAQAVASFRPEMPLQPGYSTHTGVPGAVEGQP